MRFACEGDGPAVVLLPGLGCDRRLWQAVGEDLARRDLTVIHPETWTAETLEDAACGVAGVLDELGLRTAGLAGLSMGGYLAFECLRHWPERVRAVAFLDTTASGDTPERLAKREQVLRLIAEGAFPEVLGAFADSVLAPAHAGPGPLRKLVESMGRELGPDVFARSVRAIRDRTPYRELLGLIRVPTLFLCGDQDALTPPEVAREMARRVPGARLEVVPGAGHMTTLERPRETAAALAAFFGAALAQG